MAIDFNKTFGAPKASAAAPSNGAGDRPKSRFWLNIGYDSGVANEDGKGTRFVALPAGIPLDGQEKLPTNSRNREFAAFQAARNDLMEQLMAVAESLQPGEEKLLNLQVQLRRVNDDMAEPDTANNPFARRLDL